MKYYMLFYVINLVVSLGSNIGGVFCMWGLEEHICMFAPFIVAKLLQVKYLIRTTMSTSK